MHDNLERLGPPPFDDADRAAAAKFQATLTDEDIDAAYRRVGVPMQHGHVAVRRDRAAGRQARADDGLDRCRRRELGGADGAGARRDLCDRHAGPFLAADRAGQDAGGAQGHGACGEGDGGDRGRCDPTRRCSRAPRPISGAHRAHPYVCPLPADLQPPVQPRPKSEMRRLARNQARPPVFSSGPLWRAPPMKTLADAFEHTLQDVYLPSTLSPRRCRKSSKPVSNGDLRPRSRTTSPKPRVRSRRSKRCSSRSARRLPARSATPSRG